MTLQQLLGIQYSIVQAPMAGVQGSVLRTHPRIVQPGADRMGFEDLSIFVR